MKEIGKLIELLNEYRNDGVEEYLENIKSFKIKGGHYSDLYIISKKFGFIKWLVENDKIDQREIEYKFQDALFELEEEEIVKEKSDFLIMLLSISSSSIEDLISYLK